MCSSLETARPPDPIWKDIIRVSATMTACCLICSAQAAVYCANDEAFLCRACDASSHASGLAARHTRTPVCTVCTRKAATVYCRNDAAFLCVGCDAEAHSAPLAARWRPLAAEAAPSHRSWASGKERRVLYRGMHAECVFVAFQQAEGRVEGASRCRR